MGNELLPMTTSSVEMEASAQEARSDHQKKNPPKNPDLLSQVMIPPS